jgi:deoxyuridine 5'-triphosphate nucleotidohydrolase
MEQPYVLGINYGRDPDIENDDRKKYTQLSKDDKMNFWRGYFDVHGVIKKNYHEGTYFCKIQIQDVFLQTEFFELFEIPVISTENNNYLIQGINTLEFLHQLYSMSQDWSNANAGMYQNLLYGWKPINALGTPKCKFMKTLETAYIPNKAHVSDSGYDLQLVKHLKTENGVEFYDTGIAIQPPLGYYFELVARSSLSKTGYILANSIGIIDASYTGSIKVALIKVCRDAPDIQLPARLVQLIPRQFLHLPMYEVSDFNKTRRDDGGFGSSG